MNYDWIIVKSYCEHWWSSYGPQEQNHKQQHNNYVEKVKQHNNYQTKLVVEEKEFSEVLSVVISDRSRYDIFGWLCGFYCYVSC